MDARWSRWSMDTLPMIPGEMKLKVIDRTRDQFAVVSALLRAPDTADIVCATDAGREGELIFREILQMAGVDKPAKRLWISSMTDEAIGEGFARLKDISEYEGLFRSAECRAHADWLVGMNGSRAFTLRQNASLSVGRVQTPTLAILVRRKREIAAFVPETYYEIAANFGDYSGLWMDRQTEKTRLSDPERARDIARKVKGKPAAVESVERKEEKQAPPPLFDLTSLQREANARLGLTAEQTLASAQALYETHKAVTYPRTDSRALPRDMIGKATDAMRALTRTPYAAFAQKALAGGSLPTPSRVFDDAKVTDHHAIIPTGRAASLEGRDAAVYDLIARRFIAAFFPDARYDVCRVITASEGEAFLTRGRSTIDEGFKAVLGEGKAKTKTKAEDEDSDVALPPLAAGDARDVMDVKLSKKATSPPKPHTEASLLSAMEHAGREVADDELRSAMKDSGLGTPATRAAIIERIIAAGYVARKGRALDATEKGEKLIDIAPPEIASPELTGQWEKALSDIRLNTYDPKDFMQRIRAFTADIVQKARVGRLAGFVDERAQKRAGASPAKPAAPEKKPVTPAATATGKPVCPLCGANVLRSARGFGCSRWKEGCGFKVLIEDATAKIGELFTPLLMHKLLCERRVGVKNGTLSLTAKGALSLRKSAQAQ